jgi:hypothetical protein
MRADNTPMTKPLPMIGRKIKGNVIKVDAGRDASQNTDQKGRKRKKKEKD